MGGILDKLDEWLRGLLVDGITGNLSGMFDTVNTKVGEIAGEVGMTPLAWNSGVFSMIRNLSETVIVPIAGVILTFVMCYELIQLVTEKNNMHDVDTWMFFKWIFKTFCAVLIVTNTWNIVMGIFDVGQSVVNSSAGVIIGDTSIDVNSVITDLETQVEALSPGELCGLSFQSLFVGLTMNVLSICIQSFYLHELKSVSASTVIHEHANIHKALKYAVKMDLIPFNPADKVERPKKQKYIADYYRLDELEKLFEVTKDHPYSLLIQMTAFYGLRRSEALGLKWDAIDFERNTITIRHIVTETEVDGKSVIISEDRAKTKSSLRSLPLVGHFREKLLELKEQQKENKRVCGNCYSYDYDGYIFVDAMGTIFNPNAVTENFSKILKRNGLRHIRFHDLRHSCASLLLANDVPMKQIQEWLGHSDISTTANIYSHLDYKSKITSANVMDNVLVLPDTKSQGW